MFLAETESGFSFVGDEATRRAAKEGITASLLAGVAEGVVEWPEAFSVLRAFSDPEHPEHLSSDIAQTVFRAITNARVELALDRAAQEDSAVALCDQPYVLDNNGLFCDTHPNGFSQTIDTSGVEMQENLALLAAYRIAIDPPCPLDAIAYQLELQHDSQGSPVLPSTREHVQLGHFDQETQVFTPFVTILDEAHPVWQDLSPQ